MNLMEAQRRFAQFEHVKNAYRSRDIGLLLEERERSSGAPSNA